MATGAFLSREGDWTNDVKEAADFFGKWPSLESPGKDTHHDQIEFYYWFGESFPSRYDFAIPILSRIKVPSQIGGGGSQRTGMNAVNALEVRESLGMTRGVGLGGLTAGEVGQREADVEQSSDMAQ